ncbi:MAG: isochorismatase family protein [Candidatus Cryptobacteroides sp.]
MNKIFKIMAGMMLAACCISCKTNSEVKMEIENLLIVVDVQRDFFDPTGALYVAGSEVLPEKIAALADNYDAVVFTLDWHPGNHCSFAAQGGIWTSHCVAFTQGAGLPDCFAKILARGEKQVQIFLKGQEIDKEQYGAFEDLDREGVIYNWLINSKKIDVCGIAGDYCVKESTANLLNYVPAQKVSVLTDCVRSIDDGSTLDKFISDNSLSKK